MTRLHRIQIALLCWFALTNLGMRPVPDMAPDPKTARIAIVGALPPLTNAKDAEATVTVLRKAGYAPVILAPEQLADAQVMNVRAFELLIVPHAETFPASALDNLNAYVKARGRLLCIGGPAFSRLVHRTGDRWQTLPESDSDGRKELPTLESLSPPHKGAFVGSQLAGAWLPIKRHRGLGISGNPPGRLMSADPRGDEEGYGIETRDKQWVYLPLSGPMRGALWGGSIKPEHPGEPTFTPMAPIVARLLQNVFLAQAGSDKTAYFSEQRISAGARLVNVGTGPQTIAGEIEIRSEEGTPPVIDGTRTFEATVMSGGEEMPTVMFPALPPGEYAVRTTLFLADGREGDERPVLDRVTAPFRVLPEKWNAPPEESVRIKGSQFVLQGKSWRPVGVHYWPRWIAGQEVAEFKEHWLSPGQYDPLLIEQDLQLCEKLGIDLLSVEYTAPEQAPALNDFLARCRNHHLKANVVLASIVPLAFREESLRPLLDAARLRGNPAVFALTFSFRLAPQYPANEIIPSLRRNRFSEAVKALRQEGLLISARFVQHGDTPEAPKSVDIEMGQELWDFVTAATLPSKAKAEGSSPILYEAGGFNIGREVTPDTLAAQEAALQTLLRDFQQSQANGIVIWWFPGGMRLEDASDYGLVGADGVPRPAAHALKQFATRK